MTAAPLVAAETPAAVSETTAIAAAEIAQTEVQTSSSNFSIDREASPIKNSENSLTIDSRSSADPDFNSASNSNEPAPQTDTEAIGLPQRDLDKTRAIEPIEIQLTTKQSTGDRIDY